MELASVTKVYVQDADTCSSDICLTLTLSTESGACEGPDYIVIQTSRWALDPDDLPAFFDTIKSFVDEYIGETNDRRNESDRPG